LNSKIEKCLQNFTSFWSVLYLNNKGNHIYLMKDTTYIASLVQQLRQKEVLALQGLYKIYAKEMMSSSLRITNSIKDSEDILQDSFVDSFNKIKQLKENKSYGAWLKRIVINASLKWVKQKRSFENLNTMEIVESSEDDCSYQDVPFETIQKAIQNLPDGCREIFTLYLLEGYKHKEIADELGISTSTSKSQYRYALKLLKEKLAPKVYE